MEIRSIREAAFISRFLHIVVLAAIVASGVRFGSRPLVTVLTAAWFVLFAVVYLFAKPRRR